MVSSQNRTARFSVYLFLTLVAFVAFVAGFILYVRSEKLIDRANEARLQSVQLAQELRQSSNDLTRMVRTYVVTGEPVYKTNYQAILDIRDGRRPRPVDYDNAYWDLLPAGGLPRPVSGTAVALLDRMRNAGFTAPEFARLADAKARSDALTRVELQAMALVESAAPPAADPRAQAIRMLHDAAYHEAKAGIMRPISDADRMMDQRTLEAVRAAEDRALKMRLVLIALGLAPVALLWLIRRELYAILGSSVPDLHRSIVRLGAAISRPPSTCRKGARTACSAGSPRPAAGSRGLSCITSRHWSSRPTTRLSAGRPPG